MKKKIIIFIAGMVAPIVATATSMCVHTDSYVAILSTSDDGLSYTTDTGGVWTVTVGYVTSSNNTSYISGYAGCAEAGASLTVDTADTTVGITGGEATGPYCWCVMKKPLVSYPVLAWKDYATTEACSAACAAKCGDKVQNSSSFRAVLFGSV